MSSEIVDGVAVEEADAVVESDAAAQTAVDADVAGEDDAVVTEEPDVTDDAVVTDEVEAEPAPDAEADPVAEFLAELSSREGDWFVVHSYSGHEKRVKQAIEHRIESLHMEDYIFQVEVTMEQVTEIKSGQRKQITRVRMPGYVLVRMYLTDESWGAVRNTPGVTGFVGHAHQPVPLTLDEVVSMLAPPETQAAAAGERRFVERASHRGRLRGWRIHHRHRRPIRHAAWHHFRDLCGEPEAPRARVNLRPGNPGRVVVQSGFEDLTTAPMRPPAAKANKRTQEWHPLRRRFQA